MNDQSSQLAKWLLQSKCTVAFTGAGISTESGIPDFRSPGGVWAKYQPVYYDAFMSSRQSREEYWRQKCEAHPGMANASPNHGHNVLAEWGSKKLLAAVITQNIDGLHQESGSPHVLELHGTARKIQCQDCEIQSTVEEADQYVAGFLQTGKVPDCPKCGSDRMKHATISFGQMLPHETRKEAEQLALLSDLFIALGSSLVVTPAADLPRLAKARDAKLVIINREPTPLDSLADLIVRDSIGEFLKNVNQRLANPPA